MNTTEIRSGTPDLFGDRLRATGDTLSPTIRRVLHFIDKNRVMVLASSAAQLAASIGTSDATVVRAVQALGFAGLGDLRQAVATTLGQKSNPADNMRRTLAEIGSSAERAIDVVLEIHHEAVEALRAPEIRSAIAAAVTALYPASSIFVFGMGPSAALARYVVGLLRRNGRPAQALDATGIALADQLLGLRREDALLALAYGRPYREVVATLAEARRLELPLVLVTDSASGKLTRGADVIILAQRGRAGRVALHGSTLILLEALVLGLAASDERRAVGTLERLSSLRDIIERTASGGA
jgi:DNA-binding MurR/RpiR family transcriptional regulator